MPAAALPFLRPLVAVILSSVPGDGTLAVPGERGLLLRPFGRHRQMRGYR
jgi:hypothetical protein